MKLQPIPVAGSMTIAVGGGDGRSRSRYQRGTARGEDTGLSQVTGWAAWYCRLCQPYFAGYRGGFTREIDAGVAPRRPAPWRDVLEH